MGLLQSSPGSDADARVGRSKGVWNIGKAHHKKEKARFKAGLFLWKRSICCDGELERLGVEGPGHRQTACVERDVAASAAETHCLAGADAPGREDLPRQVQRQLVREGRHVAVGVECVDAVLLLRVEQIRLKVRRAGVRFVDSLAEQAQPRAISRSERTAGAGRSRPAAGRYSAPDCRPCSRRRAAGAPAHGPF